MPLTPNSPIAEFSRATRRRVWRERMVIGALALTMVTTLSIPKAGEYKIERRFEVKPVLYKPVSFFSRQSRHEPHQIWLCSTIILKISGTTYLIPSDWTSTNQIIAIGPGVTGSSVLVCCTPLLYGGGGGGCSSISNITQVYAGGASLVNIVPGSTTVNIAIGAGNSGTDTYFDTNSVAQATVDGPSASQNSGGTTPAFTQRGTVVGVGGNGNSSASTATPSGGGAGGTHGAGSAAGSLNGGAGDNGFGGAGGAGSATGAGGNGGNGAEFSITAGGTAGSGGGGGFGNTTGGNGGNYGGGGGYCAVSQGAGIQGCIIIIYTPATTLTGSRVLFM